MAKLFKTSDDVYEYINEAWLATALGGQLGIKLKIISTTKQKQLLKLSKASKTTEYLIRENDVLTLVVFEGLWDRLNELTKQLLLQGVFSLIEYDSTKDKLSINNQPYTDLFRMRHSTDANGNEYLDKYDNALEAVSLAIQQMEEEEREKKEEEKARKAEGKNRK